MKKLMMAISAAVFFSIPSFSQTSFEFVPSGGYTFADRMNFDNSYGRLDEGLNWCGSLLFNVNRRFGIELMYNRIDTRAITYDYGTQLENSRQNVSLNYMMAGPVQSFNIAGSAVHPFIGALLGAAVSSPDPINHSSNTSFAWGAELGTNIYISPRFGLRLKGLLLAPVESQNGGYYFGSFGPADGYGNAQGIFQVSLNAGLIIGLGRVLPAARERAIYRRPVRRYYYRNGPSYY